MKAVTLQDRNKLYSLPSREIKLKRILKRKYTELPPSALCWHIGKQPHTILVADNDIAQQLDADFKFFGIEVDWFPDWDVLPLDLLSPSENITAQRIAFLNRQSPPQVSVVVASALLRKVPKFFSKKVTISQELNRDELSSFLLSSAYIHSTLVEELGQFSVRGSVIDFFPPGFEQPIRVEFEDRTVDSIRQFDVGSQRSLSELTEVSILAIKEIGMLMPIGKSFEQFDYYWKQVFSKLRSRASELSLANSVVESIQMSFEAGVFPQGFEHLWSIVDDNLTPPKIDLSGELLVFEPEQIISSLDSWHSIAAEQLLKLSSDTRLYPALGQAFVEEDFVRNLLTQSSVYEQVRFLGKDKLDYQELTPASLGIISNLKLHNSLAVAKYSDRPLLPFAEEVRTRIDAGYGVCIAVDHKVRKERLRNLLLEYELDAEESSLTNLAGLWIVEGRLSQGFRSEKDKIQFYSEYEIFPGTHKRKNALQNINRVFSQSSQLTEGDYVVHVDYGVAIYRGLKQQTVDSLLHDFLLLEYAEGAKLFVPVYALGKVQKYSGAEGVVPELTRLGGKVWEKAKQKVKQNVAELAGRLLKIMAERESKPGISFGEKDSEDQRFADLFPYEETADQAAAIESVLADMDRQRPMDRLVCGDVGYGKTEVALRAAFKAVNAGFQVAILVPTTVLAQQHYNTFKQRFAHFAVRVECLSRFSTAAENKETLAGVKSGVVDVVIGTHRLLQADVSFERLGLIIIDEEHRFGVAHKEKLKRYRAEVDVLTMTATPIPRTLHMSLVGIRDLSLIETPPVDRQVVRTFVSRYEEKLVREAIIRELSREGQVFFIFNRVQTIAEKAAEIARLVPEARVEFAHGQMKDSELEEVMFRFVNKEIDVLISTTIVESGLDIPNANTIIIQDSQNFGLAELYQLRGRVGRSSRRAYAYLFIGDPKKLGENAKKRLDVLQSLDDLGIGFRLALQDMEIRGAGNLLGKDQSGEINSVGYELYSKILKDAVGELRKSKSEPVLGVPEVDPEISIGFPSHIPPAYIPDVSQRLLLYQRMISLNSAEDVQYLAEEIEDRFGNMPEEVSQLLELMKYRTLLKKAGILSATLKQGILRLALHPDVAIDPQLFIKQVQQLEGRLKLSPNNGLLLKVTNSEVPSEIAKETDYILRKVGLLY